MHSRKVIPGMLILSPGNTMLRVESVRKDGALKVTDPVSHEAVPSPNDTTGCIPVDVRAGNFYLRANPKYWSVMLNELEETERDTVMQDIERVVSQTATKAALLSGYLCARGVSGCGDAGHENALGHGQKRVRKVRKALGYTYP